MSNRTTKEVLDDIRYSEELLSMEELSDAMKDYMKYTDELIVSMQAYIDYLLMDEDSIDGDDIKP
jgi:type II secretory pathway component PulF